MTPKTRIYLAEPLTNDATVSLSDDAFGHVIRVLRLKEGDAITVFNGDGDEYLATLINVSKKRADIKVVEKIRVANESPLHLHLGQVISRGDRMDFTLQKSVELGVSEITPLFSERCGVKLSGERLQKRIAQWQKIVVAACEQSGRAIVPKVNDARNIEEFLQQDTMALKINLHPRAEHSIIGLPVKDLALEHENRVRLLIGPEGGLTEEEISQASTEGYQEVLLGPRVLRTETAALTAITALQCRFGDLR
ncbi:16S rRNA (uracil(1498)-N(3))-methyltransferase [Thalassotalea mangrovi]|uniref:Ribosomal RNA small subunit methyltransferase E n=1 Tax=Thalassotalea mangrovi TaxID=2572245 RepID=A0A4U1BAF7_9GAMM|nr:16S rRNA (uracil(1498)-N(3))-methyltransferase [Thalassotalea mangrovi]TKB47127.1 16S rRNA (uracil(1498)-N(3))-methyltransferase [Thalassotalea mangrovi]